MTNPQKFVIDTNVIVSASLFSQSAPRQAFRALPNLAYNQNRSLTTAKNMETKITQNPVEIHPSVLAGLDVLAPKEKERVLKAIASLENFSPEQPLTANIQKFRPEQPFYLLKIDTSLRLIFEINRRHEIEIQDLVRQESLEFMSDSRH